MIKEFKKTQNQTDIFLCDPTFKRIYLGFLSVLGEISRNGEFILVSVPLFMSASAAIQS